MEKNQQTSGVNLEVLSKDLRDIIKYNDQPEKREKLMENIDSLAQEIKELVLLFPPWKMYKVNDSEKIIPVIMAGATELTSDDNETISVLIVYVIQNEKMLVKYITKEFAQKNIEEVSKEYEGMYKIILNKFLLNVDNEIVSKKLIEIS
jgi:hypothetical protein